MREQILRYCSKLLKENSDWNLETWSKYNRAILLWILEINFVSIESVKVMCSKDTGYLSCWFDFPTVMDQISIQLTKKYYLSGEPA